MDCKIEPADEKDAVVIHQMLHEHNRQFYPGLEELSFCIRNGEGKITAGVVAYWMGDTVSVEYLIVTAEERGKGYGKALMSRVEEAARERGCRRVSLRTFSFQAPNFYPKLGYRLTDVAELNFGGVSDYYYVKEL